MLVRTFALWVGLGISVASAAAFTVPAPAAHGSVAPGATVGPSPGDTTALGAHFVDGKALLLDGRLGHASVARDPRGGAASTFILATVTAAELGSSVHDVTPPVHLAIVVDRSGSMAGPKMRNAIAAATGAVERMRDGDRVTIVAFDTSASLLVPPTTIDAITRPAVETSIRTARAGGDTCISCALDRAVQALDDSPGARDEVRHVLLISDGEPTTGIRDASGLRAVAARARDRGFSISTIGVDLTFDEQIMASIAQESNGKHWFVPDASALAAVFDEELGSLQTALASEAELTIDPAPGVVIDEVFDRSFRRESGRFVVPMGAFDAAQEKTVLVRVHLPADSDGLASVAKLSLGYRDVLARRDALCSGVLAIDVRDDGNVQRELDPFVAVRLERSRTAHALLDANELFSRGRASDARAELARRQTELAKAAPSAASRAAALPSSAAGAAGDVGRDFGAQQAALDHAQAGFGAAASAAPAAAPAATTAAGRSALKTNQASATDLAF
jgi:Ca-activated chloride channel family protein